MKLRMLIVAAGMLALPAMASAQDPPPAPAPAPPPAEPMPAPAAPPPAVPAAAKDSSLEAKPVPPSDGTTCPWGCPTSSGAAGLTGPQFLALQQELRDRLCGLRHVTGRYDAATRAAVRRCAAKLGVANNPGAVLVAMDVGYGSGDIQTSGEE